MAALMPVDPAIQPPILTCEFTPRPQESLLPLKAAIISPLEHGESPTQQGMIPTGYGTEDDSSPAPTPATRFARHASPGRQSPASPASPYTTAPPQRMRSIKRAKSTHSRRTTGSRSGSGSGSGSDSSSDDDWGLMDAAVSNYQRQKAELQAELDTQPARPHQFARVQSTRRQCSDLGAQRPSSGRFALATQLSRRGFTCSGAASSDTPAQASQIGGSLSSGFPSAPDELLKLLSTAPSTPDRTTAAGQPVAGSLCSVPQRRGSHAGGVARGSSVAQLLPSLQQQLEGGGGGGGGSGRMMRASMSGGGGGNSMAPYVALSVRNAFGGQPAAIPSYARPTTSSTGYNGQPDFSRVAVATYPVDGQQAGGGADRRSVRASGTNLRLGSAIPTSGRRPRITMDGSSAVGQPANLPPRVSGSGPLLRPYHGPVPTDGSPAAGLDTRQPITLPARTSGSAPGNAPGSGPLLRPYHGSNVPAYSPAPAPPPGPPSADTVQSPGTQRAQLDPAAPTSILRPYPAARQLHMPSHAAIITASASAPVSPRPPTTSQDGQASPQTSAAPSPVLRPYHGPPAAASRPPRPGGVDTQLTPAPPADGGPAMAMGGAFSAMPIPPKGPRQLMSAISASGRQRRVEAMVQSPLQVEASAAAAAGGVETSDESDGSITAPE